MCLANSFEIIFVLPCIVFISIPFCLSLSSIQTNYFHGYEEEKKNNAHKTTKTIVKKNLVKTFPFSFDTIL